jgi:hypothetical protein
MNGKDLFGVVVRTTGFYVTLWGCYCLLYALAVGNGEGGSYISFGVVLMLTGSALLGTADFIVALSYRRVKPPGPPPEAAP